MPRPSLTFTKIAHSAPPHVWFGVSGIFHYLGPSFAVLLFPAVGVLGVAWMRIASAAVIFAAWTKPWRTIKEADPRTRFLLIGLGGLRLGYAWSDAAAAIVVALFVCLAGWRLGTLV